MTITLIPKEKAGQEVIKVEDVGKILVDKAGKEVTVWRTNGRHFEVVRLDIEYFCRMEVEF